MPLGADFAARVAMLGSVIETGGARKAVWCGSVLGGVQDFDAWGRRLCPGGEAEAQRFEYAQQCRQGRIAAFAQ